MWRPHQAYRARRWLSTTHCTCSSSTQHLAIVNQPKCTTSLKRFRTFHDVHKLHPSLLQSKPLANLNVSGSGQFTEHGLEVWLEKLRRAHPLQHLVIFDMRQEPHMFVDGHAVGLYQPADLFNAIPADQWCTAKGLQVWGCYVTHTQYLQSHNRILIR